MRDPDFSKITEGTTFNKALGDTEDKVVEGNIEIIGVMITTEVGISSGDMSFSGNYSGSRDRSSSNSRSKSGSRASTNRDRIRCYNCREYDNFARIAPHLGKKGT